MVSLIVKESAHSDMEYFLKVDDHKKKNKPTKT